jgi:3-deoxy-D-manno-octulosonate 8-phosphate phosphatase KdsC-like HAD superfamily phosphatase
VTLVYHGVSSKLATYEQILLDLGLTDAEVASGTRLPTICANRLR